MVLPSAEEAFKKLQQGDRVFLSQMISTAESSLLDHRRFTSSLLELCSKQKSISRRIGITGVPGVGKSTFINVFGGLLTSKGSKVAVLAIDPSSNRSGGSILGDKVRMTELAADENAYIRPSPTSGYLGGVNAGTRSAIILCEAAGFDTILVETVGVGQSETQIETMVDFILLLMLPGAGDEMQGIKRGIMEVADHIAINQSEKDSEKKAKATRQHYESALHLFSAREDGWKTKVSLLSSIEMYGFDAILEQVEKYFREQQLSGNLDRKRMQQEIHAFYGLLKDQLLGKVTMDESLNKAIGEYEEKIRLHEINAPAAAIQLAMQIKTTFLPPA